MTDHEKAKAWREKRNLTIDKLAQLSGYTRRTIIWMEHGLSSPGGTQRRKAEPVKPWVWHRYKMICAGIDAQLSGRRFNW